MLSLKINIEAVRSYIKPDLAELHALLKGLHLTSSLKVLELLKQVIEADLHESSQCSFHNTKKHNPKIQ